MKTFSRFFALSIIACVSIFCAQARESVTITFGNTTDKSSSALSASTLAANITSGADFIESVDFIERVFGAGPDKGLKFGSQSGGGTLAFSLADCTIMFVESIHVSITPYGKDDPMMGLWINDEEDYYSIPGTSSDFVIVLDEPQPVIALELQSLKRCYLNSITLVPFSGSIEPTEVPMPSFSIERNRITIGAPDASAIEYIMSINGVQGEPTTVPGDHAEIRILDNCTISARAFTPGIDSNNQFVADMPGEMIVREFTVSEVSVEQSECWARVTDIDELRIDNSYLIAAPDFDVVMLHSMNNSSKAYDSAPAVFSDDYSQILNVDPDNAVTWTESAAGLHGFRFSNGTYISASGDNISNASSITGSGNTTVAINDRANAIIKFGSSSSRQLLYHEGYDFRLNASINDDNPTFAMPALYRHVPAGTESFLVAQAIIPAPVFTNLQGLNITSIPQGETLIITSAPDCLIELSIDGAEPTIFETDSAPIDTATFPVGTVLTAKAFDPYTNCESPETCLTIIDSASLESVIVDGTAPTQLFDLQGRLVTNPSVGIYIEVSADQRRLIKR